MRAQLMRALRRACEETFRIGVAHVRRLPPLSFFLLLSVYVCMRRCGYVCMFVCEYMRGSRP
jgi:hypothetical protein